MKRTKRINGTKFTKGIKGSITVYRKIKQDKFAFCGPSAYCFHELTSETSNITLIIFVFDIT